MKIVFFSDIHGVAETLEELLARADALQADQLVSLGDLLYHGPRNGVPEAYDPTRVVQLLNGRKSQILTVRGNCDCEVDQMLLEFPIMAEFSELLCDGRRFFLTHGHIWNESHQPPLPAGTVLVHGHTHIPVLKESGNGVTIFNPGSISLPKGGFPRSFGFYDGNTLSVRKLADGEVLELN